MSLRDLLKRLRSSTVIERAAGALPRPVRDRLRNVYWSFARTPTISKHPQVFEDRSRGRDTLLMILAGYKPQLWEQTLTRMRKHTSLELADICVVCSGHPPAAQKLRQIAAENGWSFLQSEDDRLANAQNMAIARFPNARWISKLDEDMFVTAGWLEKLLVTYKAAEADGRYQIGFVAPLIPVNGFGYRLLLDLTGRVGEFTALFPQKGAYSAALFIPDHVTEVTEWLWRQTSPLDERAKELEKHGAAFSICPHRFSIGAILLDRSVWQELGGFAVGPEGILGYEESELCKWCMENSRAIVVSHASLVGHFSFFPQYEHMLELLQKEPELFS